MSSVERRQTRPEVKWLVNEMAAIQGELDRIEAEMKPLLERKARLLATYSALAQVSLQLDAMGLAAAVPRVKAHDTRYGGRGGLRGWLKDTLKAAYPQAIDTRALLELAMHAFGLEFSSPAARVRYMDNTFRRQLHALAKRWRCVPPPFWRATLLQPILVATLLRWTHGFGSIEMNPKTKSFT